MPQSTPGLWKSQFYSNDVDYNANPGDPLYSNKDRKYDLLGLLCTLSDHLKTNNKNKLFCSELIAEILDLKLYENQSPERIYKYIIKELG